MPVVTFKVSAQDARRLRQLAKARQTTVSAYLRSVALPPLSAAAMDLQPHPVSGCLYNAAPGRKVSDAEIRATLANFP